MGPKILIIEADGDRPEFLLDRLAEQGYLVSSVGSAAQAYEQLEAAEYDLVLLDPDLDPEEFGLLEVIRKHYPGTKQIIITSNHSVQLTIKAIRAGVVDYIQKPYQFSEIQEGVQRALAERDSSSRRDALIRSLAATLEQLQDLEGIQREELPARRMVKLPGGILIDLERRQVWRGGQQVGLTPTESNLLSVLLENRDRVLSHAELVALLQGVEVDEQEAPEILRPMVSRLRKKLALFPGTEKWVKNIRGTGYLFDPN